MNRLLQSIAVLVVSVGPLAAREVSSPAKGAVNNAAALRKLVGKETTVYGKVNRLSISKSGHHFLNFFSSNLTAVCFKQYVSKFKAGGLAKRFDQKEVQVPGKVLLYKGKPQIKLTRPQQISLSTETPTAGTKHGELSKATTVTKLNSNSGKSTRRLEPAPPGFVTMEETRKGPRALKMSYATR